MIIDFEKYKSRDLIPLKCKFCNETFFRTKNRILDNINRLGHEPNACSSKCMGINLTLKGTKKLKCIQCGNDFNRRNSQIKRYKNQFCSSSCNATYNNTHKTTGYRRSKLEIWTETQLQLLYPKLEIYYNNINTINAELDFYIPSLKLAIEFNGIFHYEPIYGDNKLKRIKTNDTRKFQACIENKIELCIIDVSSFGYFKIDGAKKYLKIITDLIDTKLAEE